MHPHFMKCQFLSESRSFQGEEAVRNLIIVNVTNERSGGF
jgi:hypothetical protein